MCHVIFDEQTLRAAAKVKEASLSRMVSDNLHIWINLHPRKDRHREGTQRGTVARLLSQ
jgi:hypothetical protein